MTAAPSETLVVVTGAAGKLGSAIVRRLRDDGYRVRGFVRHLPAGAAGVEYITGDLSDPDRVDAAVRGATVVIHAGATMHGTWDDFERGTIAGTRNVAKACVEHGVRLIHVSSLSVIDWAGTGRSGRPVDETAALEPHPERRGFYTKSKLEAERIVSSLVASAELQAVILRPGQIFGGGIALINGAVARNTPAGWLVLGDGTLELPLVYIDDVVDGIVLAMAAELHAGEIVHLVDPAPLTQRDVLTLAGDARRVIRVPRLAVFALGKLSELPLRLVGRQSPIATYRLESALAKLHYDSRRAQDLLGWQPRVGAREGIRRAVAAVTR